MKRFRILLIAVLGLLLVGCNSKSAEEDYNSVEKIVQDKDSFSEGMAKLVPTDDGCSYTASKFNGRETLWRETLEEDQEIEVECSLTLSEGTAKIVCVDAEGNLTTLLECTPETSLNGQVDTKVPMTSGKNRIKIVGYGCKGVDVEVHFKV